MRTAAGNLAEYAATRFDLSSPWAIKPKTASVVGTYATRASMPETVPLENVAFEGFMIRRRVVDAIGLPDDSFFIFYDDCDYAIRARRAGFTILAVRDAGWSASSTSTSSTTSPVGRATTCTATCSPCIAGTARTRRCEPSPG